MAEIILTQARLKEWLEYFPDTGIFRWKISKSNHVKAGDVAGSQDDRRYLFIHLDGKKHRAHRLAWLYIHGTWPKDQIDHVNRDRSDNRLENLREATHTENQRNQSKPVNNTSGHVGVYWHKRSQKWRAMIQHLGKLIYLGLFVEKADAIAARAAAEVLYWGALRAE